MAAAVVCVAHAELSLGKASTCKVSLLVEMYMYSREHPDAMSVSLLPECSAIVCCSCFGKLEGSRSHEPKLVSNNS